MDEGWQYTLLVNSTDSQLAVDYIGAKYSLVPKGYGIIRWKNVSHSDTTLPLLKFSTGDRELSPIFSCRDLYANKRIVILGDLVYSPSRRMTPRPDPKSIGPFDLPHDGFWSWLDGLLQTMGELEAKVRIWHSQCKHLLKKYQEAVTRVNRAFLEFGDFFERDLEPLFMNFQDPTLVCQRYIPDSLLWFLCRTLVCSMLDGEALLRSCGERFYNQAAFALTSAPPWVPTFSKFALAIRELAFIMDVVCCVIEGNPNNRPFPMDGWEWCEERCRLVFSAFTNRLDASEDDSLEADVRRQNADREALRSSLDLMRKSPVRKLSKSPGTSSSKFLNPAAWFGWRAGALVQGALVEDELESIWTKRLQASSCAPGSKSTFDAFLIDNPDTSFVQVPGSGFGSGTFKSVQECKWLGETVALSKMSNVLKVSAQAEIGFLARVQHPNVVKWMGYAFKEDLRYSDCYEKCFLVTEHMECDLHDLITERLTRNDGTISKRKPPFELFEAVDIALQIVEAMIHVHRCRVIHRDLKPKNILASQKYPSSLYGLVPYTIKLIDFGTSQSNDQNSLFRSRKKGTPIYMAPEVWLLKDTSEESYSWSADVYSFGLTCFEIFTGRLPLEDGMELSFANIQKALRYGEILIPFYYPGELKSLIVKCCAQDPFVRPSFEDIRKALWRLKVLHGTHGFFFSRISMVR